MKNLKDLARGMLIAPEAGIIVDMLIRRGRAISLPQRTVSEEMLCMDCGGYMGYTCRHYGKVAWFCGNPKCIEEDTGIK